MNFSKNKRTRFYFSNTCLLTLIIVHTLSISNTLLAPKNFYSIFSFLFFWLWSYLKQVIPETHRLRKNIRHVFSTCSFVLELSYFFFGSISFFKSKQQIIKHLKIPTVIFVVTLWCLDDISEILLSVIWSNIMCTK